MKECDFIKVIQGKLIFVCLHALITMYGMIKKINLGRKIAGFCILVYPLNNFRLKRHV